MPRLISKSEWGVALHAALRKCCDSDATTIAYQSICEMQAAWDQYIEHIKKNCDGKSSTLKTASLSWKYLAAPRHESALAVILHCAFKLFDEGDWDGYASFLRQ